MPLTRTEFGVTLQSSQQLVPSDKGAGDVCLRSQSCPSAVAELGVVPMPRGLIPTVLFAFTAIIFFGLGNFLAARQAAASEDDQIAALRAEVGALRRQQHPPTSGTSGRPTDAPAAVPMDDHSRAALVTDIKQQLRTEMGLM